ncbi:glycine receptor subunit alpha-2-like [Lineus longissimus]|uniref:glycine receptor subunit alpha-2-like n=1 Tax=Lineus longissimus TaxID=88925 RepID=UPI002B4EFA5C
MDSTTLIIGWVSCVLALISPSMCSAYFFPEELFSTYNKTTRPGSLQDEVTVVTVDMHVSTISSVSGISMDYEIDLYFRQTWQDPRFKFNGMKSITLSPYRIKDIWWPDTFFYNAKRGKLQDITRPNEFVHIFPDGTVNTSVRLTLLLSCFLELEYFPMDEQDCEIVIGSYGYKDTDIKYAFAYNFSTQFNENLILPEFVIDRKVAQVPVTDVYPSGNYSKLKFIFHMKRAFGYYMIQTYIPSMLVVILSWVSFWLDVRATPARISVGLLTVLTITTQASGVNSQLPRVSYIKAIDVWMSSCLVFVVVALVEFAVVNVLTRKNDDRARTMRLGTPCNTNHDRFTTSIDSGLDLPPRGLSVIALDDDDKRRRSTPRTEPQTNIQKCLSSLPFRRKASSDHDVHLNAEIMVETFSRYFFPIAFLCFNVIYWLHYWCRWFTNETCRG